MNVDENASRTLTRIAAILQIAHRDAIAALRDELMKDKANKAIFSGTTAWAKTAELEKAVVKSGAASRSTFYQRLADLVDKGLLERRKVDNTTEYRSTGVI